MADVYNNRRAFFANYGSMSLAVASDDATNPEVEVAALKGVSITPKYEIVTLYGMERVTRAAVAKHSLSVDVSMEVAMWNPDTDMILKGVLLGHYNAASAISEANINSVEYKNKVALFKISMDMIDTDALRKVTVTASDVYFESVPYELKENEFISRALTGTAKSMDVKLYSRASVSDSWAEVT